MSDLFNPGGIEESTTATLSELQARRAAHRTDKFGHRLVDFTLRKVEEGRLGQPITARAGRLFGHEALLHANPEIFDRANLLLRPYGLTISHQPSLLQNMENYKKGPQCEVMTIQQFAVIDQVAVASPEPARLPKA
jgi:hypothetical protein